jgi:mono/diheme cytochrome c family protein
MRRARRRAAWSWIATALLAVAAPSLATAGDAAAAVDRFRDAVEPLLIDRCYTCHAGGRAKGGVAFDAFPSDAALLADRTLWANVVKNVRAGLMPPAGEPRPTPEEVAALADWVKRGALGLDPADPDPGRVTLRRLNRAEYANTIRDLMGVEFLADVEFPPDDTGYGFDNIGDVLNVSPLLLEKYLQAAEAIVAEAVPTVSRVIPTRTLRGRDFRAEAEGDDRRGERLDFYRPAAVAASVGVDRQGDYRLRVELEVDGAFDFDPGRCRVTLTADGKALHAEEYAWQADKKFRYEFPLSWSPGEHRLALALEPLTPADQKKDRLDLRILGVTVEGPLAREHWGRPANFERFFHADDPGTPEGRRAYAREVLRRFATRAFRRPVDGRTVDRLAALAEDIYAEPGKTVEQGIARAMVAVLASPRFLFRVEGVAPGEEGRAFPLIDEHALAARLSYFLWSTMPDAELFDLAGRGALRANLEAQVDRMLADARADRFVANFTGQWLQARDLGSVPIDERVVLARDAGQDRQLQAEMERFRTYIEERNRARRERRDESPEGAQERRRRFREEFKLLFAPPAVSLDADLRRAMRRETELFFAGVLREDRPLLDLLDSDYTYANEKLAKLYGIPGVEGDELRRVPLPEGSPRGGVLTQGTVLVVTSNPTRTSPVKRGLFVLDNILGTPPPPPPPDIPQLEAAEAEIMGREPTLREVLELHRSKPLCASCHARMDPLGLALEDFNAIGMFRKQERGQPLDTAGRLATGEAFAGVRGLKRILREDRRADFYRCLTEKLMTYALGRGPEPTDLETVDQVVARLEREGGRSSALLMGVIESAPFQKRRAAIAPPADKTTE